EALGADGPQSVERLAERVDDTADERRADRHFEHAPGAAHRHAFFDRQVVTEDRDADRALFQVQNLSGHTAVELDELAGHGARQSVYACDAVADFEYTADVGDVERVLVLLDLLAQDRRDFLGLDLHKPLLLVISLCIRRNARRTEPS